jgi:SAM-dependent methyltransferase
MRASQPAGWEETACPLCGDGDGRELLRVPGEPGGPDYRLVECAACGLGYLNPRPDVYTIGRYYPDDYEPYQPPAAKKSWWAGVRGRLERLGLWPAAGDSMTNVPPQGGRRLLDYGCGSGWYASRMRGRGWQVTAMDINPHATAQARQHFGLDTLTGTLPHPAVTPASYDAITLGAVLEHLHDPHPVFAAAREALTPGGLLVVSVPNRASWGFRAFGPAWWPLELPRHLLHFTPATLRRLAEMHGLEVVNLRMLGRTSWMKRSCAALGRDAAGRQRHPWLTRLGRSRLFQGWLTRWTVWTGQADCLFLIARKPAAEPKALPARAA